MKVPAQALNGSSCRYKSDETSLLYFFVSFVSWSCKSESDRVISCSGNKHEKRPIMFCRDSKRVCNCIKHVSTTGKNIFTLNLSRRVSNRQSFESSSKNRFLVRMRVSFLECGFSAPLCSCALSALTNIVEFAPQLRNEINSFLQRGSCC